MGGNDDGGPRRAEGASLDEAACAAIAPAAPRATYRVQLGAGFTFEDARRLAGYLDALGVSHLYTSPFFKARRGSTHGYDLCDHNALSPEIGTRDDLERLSGALAARGMGLILDFVPNHMSIGTPDNAFWLDVLENGPSSAYAPFFDIDWAPLKPELRNKVLLPVLGDHYGRVLESGALRLEIDGGALSVRFHDARFPIDPRTYTFVLEPMLPALSGALGEEHDAVLELRSILTGLRHLPPRTETRRAWAMERRREKEILKRRLAALLSSHEAVSRALSAELARLNGRAGDPESFDALDLLLGEQAYRLSFWRTAAEEVNYRRFFDINDLAAIRMENRAVFDEAHRLVLELAAEGVLSGLRIDHPDGLRDPIGYLRDLQQGYFLERCRRRDRLAPGARPLYVVVEKILARGERLPEDWPVHGTSGYDFAASAAPLFVDPTTEARLTAIYERFIRERIDFETLVYEKKKLILRTALASELNVLAHALNRLTERDRRLRDFTLGSLAFALREVIACFPVYRTYVNERTETLSDHDRAAVERAVALARRRNPTTEASVLTLLGAVLSLAPPDGAAADDRPVWRDFVMRAQQLTGPVMAKGLEDTAFYIYNRLVSLNEVGGEPERYGSSAAAFHRANAERQRAWPRSLLATTTHDTKRSEDVRARISVLSELPDAWEDALARASAAAAPLRGEVDGRPAPDRNEEVLFYQTLLGSLPAGPIRGAPVTHDYVTRIVAYMRKATKEAKVNTSWVDARPDYDAAVEAFVRRALASAGVMAALAPLARAVAYHGMWSSLSQTLLKLTSPGVPDLYQGTELWDFSLVDPDNRRPVDYAAREAALAALIARRAEGPALARELTARAEDGRIKLFVTHAALTARRRLPAPFGDDAAYVPLAAGGRRAEHVVAFARRAGGDEIVVVVPRLTARLLEGRCAPPIGDPWSDTWIPLDEARTYADVFTGAAVNAEAAGGRRAGAALRIERLLADFPVALLVRAPA